MKKLLKLISKWKHKQYVYAGFRTKMDFFDGNADNNDVPEPTRDKKEAIRRAEDLVRRGMYYAIDVFDPADDSDEPIECVTPALTVQLLHFGLLPEETFVFDDKALAEKNLKALIEKYELKKKPDDTAFYQSEDEDSELYIIETNLNLSVSVD